MSKVIRIPEDIYSQLEALAVGFDTPASVIERLLNFYNSYRDSSGGISAIDDSSYNALDKRITRAADAIPKGPKNELDDESNFEDMNPKAQGKVRRENFLDDLSRRGIELSHLKGVIYQSRTGEKIGIATASEAEGNPGIWFLGLPKKDFYTIALLCGNKKSSHVFAIIPTHQFMKNYMERLSMDAHGQLKFHVVRDQEGLYLRIPGAGDVGVDSFVNKYDNLKQINFGRDKKDNEFIKPKEKLDDNSGPNCSENINLVSFENRKYKRLRHIYYVLYFMKQDYDFADAVRLALKIFPEVNDYQTISDKCARGFAGSVENFEYLFNKNLILDALAEKFKLSDHDRRIFEKLLNDVS